MNVTVGLNIYIRYSTVLLQRPVFPVQSHRDRFILGRRKCKSWVPDRTGLHLHIHSRKFKKYIYGTVITDNMQPVTKKIIKGMKWMVYTMDTPANYYTSYNEARNRDGSCAPMSFRRTRCGYEEVSDSGITFFYDRISSCNDRHIDEVVRVSIEDRIRIVMEDITFMQEQRDSDSDITFTVIE
uniref:Uncharacterized protein n=1 Tax=Nitrosopumivirus cobalaminus TaxID=3158414 RepID=A0AAU7N433_9VIRU